MERILKLVRKCYKYNNDSLRLFFKNGNNIVPIHQYTSCRGYIWDNIKNQVLKQDLKYKYFYIYYHFTNIIYAPSLKINEIQLKVINLLLKKLGYPEAKYYFARDEEVLIRFSTSILKNLYATSLLFLFFKYKYHPKEEKLDIEEFLSNSSYTSEDFKNKSKIIIDNWHKIFPKKSVTFKTIYGINKCLHGQGFGELVRGSTFFPKYNKKVNALTKAKP